MYILFHSRTGRAGNTGYSNTFITPEQTRSAGDIIKAFELSESEIPPALQKLWDQYKETAQAVSMVPVLHIFDWGLRIKEVVS